MNWNAKLLVSSLALGSVVGLGGCGPAQNYNHVADGAEGPTSPAESGEYGARADMRPPYGPRERAKEEHEIAPIQGPVTNGWDDPTMEGSGNLAGQGNDAHPLTSPDPAKAAAAYGRKSGAGDRGGMEPTRITSPSNESSAPAKK